MTYRAKSVIANVLMAIGVVPLALCVVWAAGLVAVLLGGAPIIPIMDPLGMIGPCVMSFLFTAAVAGTSAAWSWDLAREQPVRERLRSALVLRWLTVLVLVSPVALLAFARLVL